MGCSAKAKGGEQPQGAGTPAALPCSESLWHGKELTADCQLTTGTIVPLPAML